MRCFARWEKDDSNEVFFRDQTILQFGENWNLLANFVLLNPGSALPMSDVDQTDLLRSKKLNCFIEPKSGEKYAEFNLDPLMRNIIKLFSSTHSGGSIKLYNLFNLKNQNSNKAQEELLTYQSHPKMFTRDDEIKYCNAPVIVASGANAKSNFNLKSQLIRHIKLAEAENLYKLARISKNEFSIIKAEPDNTGFIDGSYHPSYTFNYGNSASLGDLYK